MATVSPRSPETEHLPNHLELPSEDGSVVNNFREHPQSLLLTDCILPVLRQLHPDGQYAIGQDCGIYWRRTEPPLRGCKAPDWFYVPNVPPDLDGQYRRSYVMWYEPTAPLILLEYASGDGSEERDRTPYEGKFWVYEQAIRVPYYGIFDVKGGELDFYQLVRGRFERLPPNPSGRYSVPEMGVELGVWRGYFLNEEAPWLRWWDQHGPLLPTGDERAEHERQRAEHERQRADEAGARARALAERLRALGVDPDQV